MAKKTTTRPPHPPTRRRAGGPLKIKKIKKKVKRASGPQKILFKIKPLKRIKQPKIRTLPLARTLISPKLKRTPKPVKSKPPHQIFGGGGKPIEPSVHPVRGQRALSKTQRKQTSNGAYKTRIKVIGIGGGGSSIVSEIASEVKKVFFVVANTDLQALKEVAKGAKHFQLGKSITQGLGTGMNPESGERAAESDKEKIKELLKETDFCILVSCLGGGTGSGASPVFANILKNLGILTLGIFTLPFEFEGEKRAQIAKDSLEKLRQNLNALVVIPNQKIFQIIDASTSSASILSGNRRIDKNTPLKEAFSTINKALIENLEGLITLIYSPGLIHVDFATLKTTLAGRGRLAYFNTVEIESPNQTEELVRKVVSNPLIPYAVQGAKEVLFNIDGGLNLSMSHVKQIGEIISSSINPQARVAFGITSTPTPKFGVGASKKEGIKITLLANGCKWEEWEKKKERPEKKQILITKIQEKSKKKIEEKPPEILKAQLLKKTQIRREKPKKVEIKIRRNALEIKESIEEEKKKMIAQERKWETPAFLRRKPEE